MGSILFISIFMIILSACIVLLYKRKFIFFSLLIVVVPLIKIINDSIVSNKKIIDTIIEISYSFIPVAIFGIFTNWDKVKYGFSIIKKETYDSLKHNYEEIQADKKELVNVISKFFNDGKFNKNRIAEKLNINPSDYFVVVKTSENLEFVYTRKKELNSKMRLPKFPLGSILQEIKGSLRPFQNMDLFFIPYSSIPRKYGFNHSKWLKTILIPRIEPKRIQFIDEIKIRLRLTIEEIDSLKKVAFTIVSFDISSNTIFAETLNNHVSSDLLYLVRNDKSFINAYATKIGLYLKSSELLNSIEWQTLVDIGDKYIEALNRESTKIGIELNKIGISRLVDLSEISEKTFQSILFKIMRYKYKWTEKVALNNSKKITTQLKIIIRVLRKSNVKI
jgi:hypothetical protein